jgi:hypothetical protein
MKSRIAERMKPSHLLGVLVAVASAGLGLVLWYAIF